MEKKFSIFFSKLSPIQEKENYLIELSINNKTNIIAFPQKEPLIISFSDKKEKQIISINLILKQISNKQKLIGHGEIALNTKFLNQKPIEKYILIFKENKQKNKVNFKLNNSNCFGKIFVQIKLDETSNFKKLDKEKESSKESSDNKNDEFKKDRINNDSMLEKKESDKNILELDKFKDILLYNNIDEILSYENIIKLKEKIENEKILFPKDINYLKSFNKNLFNQCKLSNEKFSKILALLSEENQNIEKKLKETELKNNEIEEEINNLQLILNKKAEEIKQKTQEIESKNNLLSLKNPELIKNKDKKINDKKEQLNSTDVKNICDLITKFFALGYNIQEGDLTENEKQDLYDLLTNNINKDNYDENEIISMRDDLYLADEIISLIERDVNDLFSRNLIELVTIDQVDSISYIFSGKEKKKEISFKLENNNLICSTGESFSVWLIKNFSV